MSVLILDAHRKPEGPQEVDWNNSVTRGLIGFWLMNERGGLVRNIARPWGQGVILGDAPRVVDANGRAIRFDASDAVDLGADSAVIDLSVGNAATMVWGFTQDNPAGTGHICSKRDGGTTDWQLFLNSGNPTWVFGASLAHNTDLAATSFNAWGRDNNRQTAALYSNGVLRETFAPATTAPTHQSTINISIAARWQSHPTTAFTNDGEFYYVLIWDRKLPNDELRALTHPRNVYGLVKRKIERAYFVPAPAADVLMPQAWC